MSDNANRDEEVPAKKAKRNLSRRHIIMAATAGLVLGGGGGFAGGWFAYKASRTRKPRPPMAPAYVEIAKHNLRIGPDPAKVTIVEFLDFQ